MTSQPHTEPGIFNPQSQAFNYVLIGAVSLGALCMAQMQRGQSKELSLLTFLAGAAGIVVLLRLGPTVVLGLVAIGEITKQWNWGFAFQAEFRPVFDFDDVLLCMALLGYVASQYRLQALGRSVFSRDERLAFVRKPASMPPVEWQKFGNRKRAPGLVASAELMTLAISLVIWAVAAQVAWFWLARPRNVLQWNERIVQLTIAVVSVVVGMTLTAWLLRHFRRRRMSHQEAALIMQDTLWNETRGEQRNVARWLARFWLLQKERP